LGHDEHGGGGADFAEEFAVDAAYGFPVGGLGEVDTGANHVYERCAGADEDFSGDSDDYAGLDFYVGIICAHGASAGNIDMVVNAHGAREADNGFVGGRAGEVISSHDLGALPWSMVVEAGIQGQQQIPRGNERKKSRNGVGFCGVPPFPTEGKDGAHAFVVSLRRATPDPSLRSG